MLNLSIKEIYSLFINSCGICTDTRNIISGSIFLSLKGENFNGNTYSKKAITDGCIYAIVDEKEYATSNNHILVQNCLKTLQELANYHRKAIGIPIISITGTNGKTTSKELINAVLSSKFKVNATKGNLNNHIGVPLTLLSFTKETEIGIVEMGANHVGEIKELCNISLPDFGIITNIGKAHIEGFGSVEGIIKAKGELFTHIIENKGKLIVNSDDDILIKLIENKKVNTIKYGSGDNSIINAEIIELSPFLSLNVYYNSNSTRIDSKLIGQYNKENILLACTVGTVFNIDLKDIAASINNYTPNNNRSQLLKTKKNNLFLDCYNANPTSMKLAIENFIELPDRNKTVILGDMKELGEISITEHTKIAEQLKNGDFNNVFLVGEIFNEVINENKYKTFSNINELCNYLKENPISSNSILIKGSRSIKLEKVVELL